MHFLNLIFQGWTQSRYRDGRLKLINNFVYKYFYGYNEVMEKEQVIPILRQNQEVIRSYGVSRLALFGSVARGKFYPGSDVDLLVEFDRPVGLLGLISLQLQLESMLGCHVDVGTVDCLKSAIRKDVLEECVIMSPRDWKDRYGIY